MNTKHPYSFPSRPHADAASPDPSSGERREESSDASGRREAPGEQHTQQAKGQARAREAYAAAHDIPGAQGGRDTHTKPEAPGGHDMNGSAGMFDGMPSYGPSTFSPLGGLFSDDQTAYSAQADKPQADTPSDDELLSMCRKRICPECPVKKEADDVKLRSLADLDNARKRLSRERDEQIRFASEAVLADLLPSLDTLDLALQHAGNHDVCKTFVVGVQMTRKLLIDSLQKHGLVQTGTVGEEFDPARHEAVGMQDASEVPEGHVCELLTCGYVLKDRLLRPARVVVCKRG